MGSFLSSFTPDSFCSALSFAAGEAKYIWDLESNLRALQSELDKLIEARDGLLNKVILAEKQHRTRRTSSVKGWLERVGKKESEVVSLQKDEAREIDRLCLGGFCSSNLISSYNFGKRVVALKQEAIDLKNERGQIEDVAELIPIDAAIELAVEQRIGQESKFEEVWRYITEKENEEGIIGLHGQGGVGKTTLLKHVNNNFLRRQHHFDVVIWVVVSREPKLDKIQEDIGERIGLSGKSWNDKSVESKASDISDTLSTKKFVLLLDDIWQHIDLTDVGVPLQSLNTGSKIVFTTRSIGVCGEMNAGETMIEVSTLTTDEAKKLFEGVVGRYALASHSSIPKLAETLAKECHGLPLVLKTVGQPMASERTPEGWTRAIKVLRTSASKFSGMEEKVFSRLKFSYDNLSSDELRSCLLYCCLFPEDFEISKTDLIAYWISEGFLEDLDDGYTAIRDLLRAYLLEEGEDDSVKLHDLIRDTALWIACKIEKEKENFLVCTRGQEAPKIKDWNGVKRVSIIDNRIASLSEIPNCHRLQTLILDESTIEVITEGFFQSMPSLRVLSLRRFFLPMESIPSGILCLVSLHHLDLSNTYVRELPQELKALVNLRYLNLDMAFLLSRIPHQLICSFSKLQALRMLDVGIEFQPKADSSLFEDALPLMKELLCLEHLNLITLTLLRSRAVQFFFESPKLVSITQLLNIRYCEILSLNFLTTMEDLKELGIYDSSFQDLKIEVLLSGLHSLRRVVISYCSTVKDLTWLAFAPNLKIVDIDNCNDVEEIISFEKLSGVSEIMAERNLFPQLESLSLIKLHNLKSICRDPLPFPQLKNIYVKDCRKLKKLPLNSNSAKDRKVVIQGMTKWWEELQWEDQATQNAFSTCFQYRYY